MSGVAAGAWFVSAVVLLLLLGLPVVAALVVPAVAFSGFLLGPAGPSQLGGALIDGAGDIRLLTLIGFALWSRMLDFGQLPARLHEFLRRGRDDAARNALALIWSIGATGAAGRAIAEDAMRGRARLPAADELGLTDGGTTAFFGAIATGASLMTPSLALVVYAIIADVSVGNMLLAGLIPALAYLFALGLISGFVMPRGVTDWPVRIGSYSRGGPGEVNPLATLSLVAAGIALPLALLWNGLTTPVETAVIAVVAILLTAPRERGSGWRPYRIALLGSASDAMRLFVVFVGTIMFSRLLAFSGTIASLGETISSWDEYRFVLIYFLLAVVVLVGMLVETPAAVMIPVPITVPIAANLGYDVVWFGVATVVAVELGRTAAALLAAGYRGEWRPGLRGDVTLLFVAAQLGLIVALVQFPEIALALPGPFVN